MPRPQKPTGNFKRLTRRAVLGAVIGAFVIGGVLLVAGPRLAKRVTFPSITFDAQGFVAAQLIGIVNSHLRPEFAFDTVTYESPGTVRLSGVSLTTPEGVKIIEAGAMTVILAEVPRADRPIKIEKVAMQQGVVRLMGDGEGGLVGFSRMTKGESGGPVVEAFRLSNVLVLRRVELDEVSIEYREHEQAEPIRLDHINSAMDIQPDAADGPGWYSAALKSGRAPGLEVDFAGRVNLDTYDIRIDTLEASIDAGPGTIATLPGPLASLLEQHEVRGLLEATGRASFNANNPLAGEADLTVRGEGLHTAIGEYQLPVESLHIAAALRDSVLKIDPMRAELLEGTLRAQGDIRLSAAGRPASLSWTLEGINLRDALRQQPESAEPPRLAGILSGRGEARTLLETPRASLSGGGEARVKDGRLLLLPGLTQLSNLINKNVSASLDGASNHRGSAVFTLGPDGVTVTESEMVTNTIAARGTGLIGFDRSLDLRVNAGPLEKLQSLLGVVGDLIAKATDRLIKYTIKGTIDEPVVGVAPLGFD